MNGLWAVGFVAYEAAAVFEEGRLPVCEPTGEQPLACFGIFRNPVGVERLPSPQGQPCLGPRTSLWSFDEYVHRVEEIRFGIAEGEFYQVNLTFPLIASLEGPAEDLFLALAACSGASGAAYLGFEKQEVLCWSPELFFEREGERIEMAPMKGTRPRGRFPSEDLRLAKELRSSEKEQAENLMILDMVRNDLGRIASTGSVEVAQRFRVESYPTVWQMTSTVTARSNARLLELFAALFPCASVTGAPKRAAMAAIAKLEGIPRGVYCGAVGWVGPGGRARFSVAIRTAEVACGRLRFGVGSGITWDANPAEEWEECWAKAKVLEPWPIFALIETLRWEPDRGFPFFQEHWNRLRSAAERFEFDFDFDRKKLFRRLQAAVANKREPQRVRVELWADGRTRIETAPLLPESASWRLSLADEKVDPKELWLFFKTTLRGRYDRALAAARASGADEAVFLNTEGLLTEGTRTNLFVKLEGRWWTPPLESGLLPGVYRQHLLQTGRVRERALRLEDLARAEGLAVGNALRGWIPAVRWFPLREGT